MVCSTFRLYPLYLTVGLSTYLACAVPDIAHLQEAGTQFAAAWLAGLPYRVCVGPLFPGGGLVTLVHARLLNGSQVREHAEEHSLSVRIEPARGAVLYFYLSLAV